MNDEVIFSPQLGDIFDLEQYSEYCDFAIQNNYQIIEIEPLRKVSDDGYEYLSNQYKLTEKPTPTYIEHRQQIYPPISEQLDMIYWDSINKTHNWQETITAIKAQFPKPVMEENDDR